MAPSKKRPEEKREEVLRGLQRQAANRRCADCTEKLPQSIIMDFGTFVCTVCSGIHREFSHRVKSISLSNFTDEEVETVKKGGNDVCNALYMARHDSRHDIPEPDGASAEKRREFIRMKYVDKRWYATPEDMVRYRQNQERAAAARPTSSGNIIAAEPLRRRKSARAVNGANAASIGRPLPAAPGAAAGAASATPANDLLDLLSSPAPSSQPAAPVAVPAAMATAAPVSPWHAFGGSPQASFGAAPAPWDAFGGGGGGGGGTPQPQQPPQPQHSSSPQGGFGLAPPPPPPRTHDQHVQQQRPPQQQVQPQQGFAQFPQQPFGGAQQQPQHTMPGAAAAPGGAVPFAAFGEPAPPPHQQYYAPHQQNGYPQQQQQQQHPQQQAFGQSMPPGGGGSGAQLPPAPRPAPEDITDPFAALSVRDSRAPSAPRYYEAGENCWYVSNGERSQVLVMKVHHDAGDPPYYTIRLASGFEKQTDYLHLNKADGAAPGQGQAAPASHAVQQQQKVAVADPFSALDNSAWAKVGSPPRGGGNNAVPLPAVAHPTVATPVPPSRDAAANPFVQGQGWSPPSNGFHPPAAHVAPATAGNPFDMF